MIRRLLLLVALLALAPVTAYGADPKPSGSRGLTVIVSVDGLGWEVWEASRARLPYLDRVALAGFAAPARTVFPSMTWPAHVSLMTGATPARHGIVGNRFVDRTTRKLVDTWTLGAKDVRVPTLFDVAKAAGLTSAALLWPNTAGSPAIAWNLPEVYGLAAFEAGSTPALLTELRALGVPIDHLGRLGNEEQLLLDSLVRDAARHVLSAHRPAILALHFVTYDTLAHTYGPTSREALWGLELVDTQVAAIARTATELGLWKDADLFIVSDHGFLTVSKRIDPAAVLAGLDKKAAASVSLASNGHALFVYLTGKGADPAVLATVEGTAAALDGVERVLLPADLVKFGLGSPTDDARVPDRVILARPDTFWSASKPRKSPDGPPPYSGMHGYLPTHPSLRAVFLGAGSHVAQQPAPPQDLSILDVAPTIAATLGLTGLAPDGRARPELLRAPSPK
jgi:predicted AlkP superfamily pyrophosphatase or phosphodiesterase